MEDEKILEMDSNGNCTKMYMSLIPLICTFKICSSSTISGVCILPQFKLCFENIHV